MFVLFPPNLMLFILIAYLWICLHFYIDNYTVWKSSFVSCFSSYAPFIFLFCAKLGPLRSGDYEHPSFVPDLNKDAIRGSTVIVMIAIDLW